MNANAEANAYPDLVNLLTDNRCGIGLKRDRVVVDSSMTTGVRPDLQIWLDVAKNIRTEAVHLYGVIEAKPKNQVVLGGPRVAKEKFAIYKTTGLRYFWLHDAEIIQRFDLDERDVLPAPIEWKWDDLRDETIFLEAFAPLSAAYATLQTRLELFEKDGASVKRVDVDELNRIRFIESVLRVARLLSEGVSNCVQQELKLDLRSANVLLEPMATKYGKPTFDWNNLDEPITFAEPPLNDSDLRKFERKYVALLDDLEPYLYALRAEHATLPAYAARSGIKSTVSFLGSGKDDKRAAIVFVQETSSLLLSRLLMIRFSEDHGLLRRYMSNGGVSAFARYADHLKRPYQALVREAYRNARPVYRHLFAPKTLDWVISSERSELSTTLLHALWILAHWNLKTVRGDILSGIYDRYLEPAQKRALGEIYTRPEIARYLIERSGWDRTKTLLDPACGTGTFLVEALEIARSSAISSGFGFTDADAIDIIDNLYGLDLNEFSATLAKIQMLWHVLTAAGATSIKETIRALSVEGGQSSLETWGIPMARAGATRLGFNSGLKRMRQRRDVSAFRSISTNQNGFDVVAGNPPYVSVKNAQISPGLLSEYDAVSAGQTDLSALFFFRALEWWLKPGGRLAFIVNFALANTAAATKLRDTLRGYKIIELINFEDLGQSLFTGISVVAMGIIVEKTKPSPDDIVQITTVLLPCLNKSKNEIDMSRAVRVDIERKFINLDYYIPSVSLARSEGGDDEESVANNSLLLSVQPNDVDLLKKLASGNNLDELVRIGYRKRSGASTVNALIAPPSNSAWLECKVQGFGIETGGAASGTTPVFGADSIFPDRIAGTQETTWDGKPSSIVNSRFYRWNLPGIDFSKVFVFRKVSLVPQACQHPRNVYFRNTCNVVHLKDSFPLNFYLLSRIPQWFAIKLLRSSVVQGYYSTWVSSMIYKIPIPKSVNRTSHLYSEIDRFGSQMAKAQAHARTRETRIASMLKVKVGHSVPLRSSGLPVTLPAVGEFLLPYVSAQDITVTRSGLDINLAVNGMLVPPTISGKTPVIKIADPDLSEWIFEITKIALASGVVPILQFFREIPVSKSISADLATLKTLLNDDPQSDYNVNLRQLDTIIADALGLNEAEREMIINEIETHPILSRLRPTWA